MLRLICVARRDGNRTFWHPADLHPAHFCAQAWSKPLIWHPADLHPADMDPADLKPADLRPAGLISKMQKTQGPFAQKGLRPPAGTPRRHMCGFHHACQQKYPSGLKNPCLFRGPRRGLQGPNLALLRLWCGSGSGQPPKRPPRGSQEAPTRPPKRVPRGPQEAPQLT